MARHKHIEAKRQAHQSALKERLFPLDVNEHATQLEHDFSIVNDKFIKSPNYSVKWSKSIKTLMRDAVEEAFDKFFAINVTTQLSVKDKAAFSMLAVTKIGTGLTDEILLSIPEGDFVALRRSYQDLLDKIRGLHPGPTQSESLPQDLSFNKMAHENDDDSSSNQLAQLSVVSRPLGSLDEKTVDSKARRVQVRQSGIRLQGSVDLSADEDESDQKSDGDTESKIKEENYDEATARASPNPAMSTIELGVPLTADHYRFTMLFKDELIGQSLARMRPCEIWQLVCDSIDHDPDIPSRASTSPWVADVEHQNGNCLAFRTKSREDLDTLTANIQWAQDFCDTLAAGINIYRIVLEKVKIKTDKYKGTASIIDRIRKENSSKIPSLNHIGAIRDVMMLPNPVSQTEQDEYADYILSFGSREAACTALENGLHYGNKKHACVVYSPSLQWPQRCSYSQGHVHAAQDCPSMPMCGQCGYAHETNFCISAKTDYASRHGDHRASNKEHPNWLEAEEKVCRSYGFPAGEDVSPQTWPAAKNSAALTLTPPTLPLPVSSEPQDLLTTIPSIASTSQIARETTSSTDTDSTLLQLIDEFRAFVAARQKLGDQNSREQKKRKAAEVEYLMSGALQSESPERKRTKTGKEKEEEGPVWPIGYADYEPPSLKKKDVGKSFGSRERISG